MATSFATRHCINRAKLIKRATPAETRFLRYLESLGLSYRFQQGFFTPYYRIADFYLPELNLIVEIDGPYHDAEEDRRKDELFTRARGIRVVRFTNEEVLSGDIERVRLFVR
jgi:very-short-patch-repair endonuclease